MSNTNAGDAQLSGSKVSSGLKPSRVAVVVPTLNAGDVWKKWLQALELQTLKPDFKLLIDSSSDDKTVALAKEYGFDVLVISRSKFDHGGTRSLAAQLLEQADILVYLTQDAIFASNSALENIVECFADQSVASAYGRQLPAANATVLSAHHRAYNYPATSFKVTRHDLPKLGIRAAFCSNSFAAYRRKSLLEVGGFSEKLIMGEDMLAALKLIEAGHSHLYCAEATVYHSHNFSLLTEFRRFFDMGVFHRIEKRITKLRRSTKQEGKGYVAAELSFAWRKSMTLFCMSFLRNAVRAIAYSVGRSYKLLPIGISKLLSNNPAYWGAVPHGDTNDPMKGKVQ